jgi:hypothetical protein
VSTAIGARDVTLTASSCGGAEISLKSACTVPLAIVSGRDCGRNPMKWAATAYEPAAMLWMMYRPKGSVDVLATTAVPCCTVTSTLGNGAPLALSVTVPTTSPPRTAANAKIPSIRPG